MELDKVAAVLRRRRGTQAIDLGILLGRRFWPSIMRPWLVLVVPLLLVVQSTLYVVTGSLVVAVAVGWWLKPLFDRVTLNVISRGFFGSTPSTRDTVRAVCRQWCSLEALRDLTLRRFTPFRSMVMPVRVLEGNRGKSANARVRSLLDGEAQSHGLLLIIFGVCFKGMIYGALLVLLMMVTPTEFMEEALDSAEYLLIDGPEWLTAMAVISATTLATTMLEPFFGAGGFGIYIQRRTEREGWDLELRFRQLAARLDKALRGLGAVGMAVGFAALMSLVGWSTPAVAQEDVPQTISEDVSTQGEAKVAKNRGAQVHRENIPVSDPNAELRAIMEAPPFGNRVEMVEEWQRINEKEEEEVWEPNDFLKMLSGLMAGGFRILMWILAGLLLVFVSWKVYRYLENKQRGPAKTPERSRWEEEILSQGGDLRELPEDIAGEARGCWERGEHRRALAILLLSSLLRFEAQHSYRFVPGWTTARCAREVASQGRDGAVLAQVARDFGQLAWAGKEVTPERFETLLSQWSEAFGRRGGSHE